MAARARPPTLESDYLDNTDKGAILKVPTGANKYIAPSKLIVLSTGAQLKLYPMSADGQVSANSYYVLEAGFARPKSAQQNGTDQQQQQHSIPHSIIGSNSADSNGSLRLITRLDTFVDARFCRATCNCLVVVWFDSNERSVHYGSVDLDQMLSTGTNQLSGAANLPVSSRARQVDKVLSLTEFADPIQVCAQSSLECNVVAMSADKVRLKLFLVTSEKAQKDDSQIKQTLSVAPLRPMADAGASSDGGGGGQSAPSSPELVRELEGDEQAIESSELVVDELSGRLFYYLDASSEVRALHLSNVRQSNHSTRTERVALNKTRASFARSLAKIASFAWSTSAQKFFWISETTNEVYSADASGDNLTRLGSLRTKPLLRSIDRLDVMDATLYLSDSVRKSIVCFELASESGKSASLSNAADGSSNKSHRVLVVEMPTVLDFRALDLSRSQRFEGLSCFDDELERCTRSIAIESGKTERHVQTESTCDVNKAADWKQEISDMQLNGSRTTNEDTTLAQQTPLIGPEMRTSRDNRQTYDLSDESSVSPLKLAALQFGLVGDERKLPAQSKYVSYRPIVVAFVLVASLLVIVCVIIRTRSKCTSNRAQQLSPSMESFAKTDPLRSHIIRSNLSTDKRPLVATIDCEAHTHWNQSFNGTL